MQGSVLKTFPCSTWKWPSASSGQDSREQAVPGGSGLLPAGDTYSLAPGAREDAEWDRAGGLLEMKSPQLPPCTLCICEHSTLGKMQSSTLL